MKKLTRLISSLVIASTVITTCSFSNIQNVKAADTNNDDWLHCVGNKIYDMSGKDNPDYNA
jgi:hypothetical protein